MVNQMRISKFLSSSSYDKSEKKELQEAGKGFSSFFVCWKPTFGIGKNCDSRSNFSEREKERHSFPFQNKMSFCFSRCFRPFFFTFVYLVFIAFEKVKRNDFCYTIQFSDLTRKLLFPVFWELFFFSYICVLIFRYHFFFTLARAIRLYF